MEYLARTEAKYLGIVLAGVISGVVVFLVLSGSGILETDTETDRPGDDGEAYQPTGNLSSGSARPVEIYIRAILEDQEYRAAHNQLEPGVRSETDFDTWRAGIEQEREAQERAGWQYEFVSIVNTTMIDADDYEEATATVVYTIRKYRNETTDPDAQDNATLSDGVNVVHLNGENWKLIEAFNPYF